MVIFVAVKNTYIYCIAGTNVTFIAMVDDIMRTKVVINQIKHRIYLCAHSKEPI